MTLGLDAEGVADYYGDGYDGYGYGDGYSYGSGDGFGGGSGEGFAEGGIPLEVA